MSQRKMCLILKNYSNIFLIGLTMLTGLYFTPVGYASETIDKTEAINTITSAKESEQRFYPRYEIKRLKKPVVLEHDNSGILGLINISRGGIAIRHNNSLQLDDIIHIHLLYEDISIHTNARIVFSRNGIAGAEFIIDEGTDTFNELLYLNVKVEADNGLLVTKLSEG